MINHNNKYWQAKQREQKRENLNIMMLRKYDFVDYPNAI